MEKEKKKYYEDAIKNRNQHRFHYFQFDKLIKYLVGKDEVDFTYIDPLKMELNKFPKNKANRYFSVDLKNKNLAKQGNNEELSEILKLQEEIVNKSGFEEELTNFIKDYNEEKGIEPYQIIEKILFLYQRARRVSFDFVTFSYSMNKENIMNLTANFTEDTNIIEDQSNVNYILNFATWAFTYFGFDASEVITDYRNKLRKIIISIAISNIEKMEQGIFNLNDVKQNLFIGESLSPHAISIADVQIEMSYNDELTLKKNIKNLMSEEWGFYIMKANNGFPISNEPYGIINHCEQKEGIQIEELTKTQLKKHIIYLYLNKNEILLMVNKGSDLSIDESIRYAATCLLVDPEIIMLYHEDDKINNKIFEIKKELFNPKAKHDIWVYERYNKYFDEVFDILDIDYKEIN